jgi:hypothetical protein
MSQLLGLIIPLRNELMELLNIICKNKLQNGLLMAAAGNYDTPTYSARSARSLGLSHIVRHVAVQFLNWMTLVFKTYLKSQSFTVL